MKIVLKIHGAEGYGADQVKGLKVKDLIELLEDYDEEDEIITYDTTNRYGASYGRLFAEVEDEEYDEDEEDY